MKKFLKTMACAMMVIAMTGTMSSCKKNKVTETETETEMQVSYTAKLNDCSWLTGNQYNALRNYFKTKGALIPEFGLSSGDYKTYAVTGTDESDCYAKADVLAKADFDEVSKKFVVEEVQALIMAGRSFKYVWYNCHNGNVVGSWTCPEKPVPAEFGTLTVDNDTVAITKAYKNGGTVTGIHCTQVILLDEDWTYGVNLIFSNLQEEGQVPVGQFEFETGSYIGHIEAKNIEYNIISGVCNITEENNSYTIVSSGKAEKDGVTINFELNCTSVVFKGYRKNACLINEADIFY